MRLPVTLPIQRSHPLARLLSRGEVAALTLRADGRLGLEFRDGRFAEAEVARDTTVFTALVVLRYRVAGRERLAGRCRSRHWGRTRTVACASGCGVA